MRLDSVQNRTITMSYNLKTTLLDEHSMYSIKELSQTIL